ncbi:shikimate kinase [Marinimicrobium locisalis]|uniref:shikimate kinase n=1 Tax=Marinimicrobium locisalis TaxID=546022 RepID=UPI0032221E96
MVEPVGNSLVLVGMPGAGKSTVGLLLAKELVKAFVDTDILIQTREGKTLQDIVHDHGFQHLREREEEVLLECQYLNHVIATGGSVVYSERGMNHLKRSGRVVFLDVPLEELERRVQNFSSRGIACPPGQSLADVFEERRALYQRYADIVVDCGRKNQDQVVSEIIYSEGEQFADVDA